MHNNASCMQLLINKGKGGNNSKRQLCEGKWTKVPHKTGL